MTYTIRRGETWVRVFRWETEPFVYTPITGISASAPVSITAVGHGLVDGWRAAITGLTAGPKQLNATGWTPKRTDFHQVTVASADVVSMNKVSSATYPAYVSGGYLMSYTPVSLAGYTARMALMTEFGGTELVFLTTENGGIAIDDVAKTITLTIDDAVTAALPLGAAIFDIEMVSGSGVVTPFPTEDVVITDEATTSE